MIAFRANRYAPVSILEIDRESLSHGFLQGYAAPKAGPKPCRVELVAAEQLVAVANASGFSDAALAADVRLGWCRFTIGGLQSASALADTLQLRCAVSGRVVQAFKADDIKPAALTRPRLTLPAFRSFIAELDGCFGSQQIYPFLQSFLDVRGDRAFIEAMYVYLIGRNAAGREVDEFLLALPADWAIEDCWKKMTSSLEFTRRQQAVLPGVFAPGFPFGLDLLG